MADTYDVTGQRKTTRIVDGDLQNVVEVDYVTKPHGIKGTVIVPEGGYTFDAVRDALEAAALVDEQIASH